MKIKLTEKQLKNIIKEMRFDGKSTGLFSEEESIDEGRKKKRKKRKSTRSKSKKKKNTLCARGKSAAKAKFDVYPSAYANGYAVQVCKGTIAGLDGNKKCSGSYCRGKKNESYEIGNLEVVERLSEVEEFDTWDDYMMSDYPNDPENRWDINSKKRRIHNDPDMEEDGRRWFNLHRNKYGTFRVKPHDDGYVGTFGSDDNDFPWITPNNSNLNEDLATWFGTKKKKKGSKQPQGPWVNICRKKKGGGHPACGRSDSDKGGYPVCRAKSVASNMSQDAKDSACRRKRRKEKNDGKSGKGQSPSPIKVKNYKPRKRKTSKRKSSKRKSKKNESVNINRMMITENRTIVSEGLRYHLDNQIPLSENIYRYGSDNYFNLINEVKKLYSENKIDLSPKDIDLITEFNVEKGIYEGKEVWLNAPFEIVELNEAEYRGRKVSLNSPKKSGSKNYVYVTGCLKDKNKVKRFEYGSAMRDKLKDPDRRNAYSARHGCEGLSLKDKCTKKYWACRKPKDFAGVNAWW